MAKKPELTYKATHIQGEMYQLDTCGYGKSPTGRPVKILVKSEKLIISRAKQKLEQFQADVRQAKAILVAIKAAKLKKKANGEKAKKGR